LFDEIDTIFGPRAKDNEDIRGLLNAGHRRGAKTYRSVLRGRQVKVEAIEAFCPVALAGIGWLPDTLMSRSVIVRMRRRHQAEKIEPFRRRIHGKQGERIRNEIGAWVRSVPDHIEWPDLPREIQDRAADIWEPLIAVADLAGGKWPRLAREAAVALVAVATDTEPSVKPKTVRIGTNTPKGYTRAEFNTPHNIAADAKGNVYVADRGNRRIQVFDSEGTFLRIITIDVPFDENARPAIGNKPDLKTYQQVQTFVPGAPWTVCITPPPNQVLYTSDAYPGRVYKLSLDGKVLGVLGQSGKQLKQFGWVHEIACPSENEIYVAELLNWRVQKLILHPEQQKAGR
jgi:hypothetical protein